MEVEIRLATIRDVSYILGNLRPGDRDEIACQIPPGAAPVDLAPACVQFGRSWVAYVGGSPALAFGVAPMTAAGNVMSGWAFGTRRCGAALRPAIRFCRDVMMPAWIEDGVTRIEARSLASHSLAHGWMAAIGAVDHGLVEAWGRGGEAFRLFVWTDTPEMRAALDKHCR